MPKADIEELVDTSITPVHEPFDQYERRGVHVNHNHLYLCADLRYRVDKKFALPIDVRYGSGCYSTICIAGRSGRCGKNTEKKERARKERHDGGRAGKNRRFAFQAG